MAIKDISEAGFDPLLRRHKTPSTPVLTGQNIIPDDYNALNSSLLYDEIIDYTLLASFTGSADISYKNQNYREAPVCIASVTFDSGSGAKTYQLPFYESEDAGFVAYFPLIYKYVRIIPNLRTVSVQVDSDDDPPSSWQFKIYVLKDNRNVR